MYPRLRTSLVASACLALTACANFEADRINYRSASKAATLDVPPDLTQLSRENRYTVPGQASIAGSGPGGVAIRTAGEAHIERLGDQQWLVVQEPPEKVWEAIKTFWQDAGFVLLIDQPKLGIMETDWAENRAKIPQDVVRRTIGRVFENLYSTSQRDKFRTRLEARADGGTDVYITHRGVQEVLVAGTKDQTGWQPRPSDPELQAEFVKRLMHQLTGSPTAKVGETQAATTTPAAPVSAAVPVTSRATLLDKEPAVELDDGFDRAWRRIGLSLDRTGFTVEDRDRAQRTFFVRYIEPVAPAEQGLLQRIFKSDASSPPVKLRVLLRPAPDGAKTHVVVQQTDGKPAANSMSQKIVNVLVDDLK